MVKDLDVVDKLTINCWSPARDSSEWDTPLLLLIINDLFVQMTHS